LGIILAGIQKKNLDVYTFIKAVRGFSVCGVFLFGADFKHFGAASRTSSLKSWFSVFHGDAYSVWVFFLCAAFNTVHASHI